MGGISSVIVGSGKKSWVIDIDEGSRKTNALHKGYLVFLAEVG